METPKDNTKESKKDSKPKPPAVVEHPTTPKLILHNGRILEHGVRGGFDSYFPYHEIPDGAPYLRWLGQKARLDEVWYPLMAFFEAQYDKHGGESTARLFYNPDDPPDQQRWKVWVFPQEISSGMTAKELPDHPQRKIQSEALGSSYICYGSVHHHCKMSAFQSGTDEEDEANQNGLHITVGHIGMEKYDLDMRCYVGRIKYKLDPEHYSNWFDMDPEWLQRVPERIRYEWLSNVPQPFRAIIAARLPMRMRSSLHGQLLVMPPPKDTEFPAIWLENMIDCRPTQYNGCGQWHGNHQSVGLFQQTGDIKDAPCGEPIWSVKNQRWEKKTWDMKLKTYVMLECPPPVEGARDLYHPRTPDAKSGIGFQNSKFPPSEAKQMGALPIHQVNTISKKDETDFLEDMAFCCWELEMKYDELKQLFANIGDQKAHELTGREAEVIGTMVNCARIRNIPLMHARWAILNKMSQDDIDITDQFMDGKKAHDHLPNGAPPHGEKYDPDTNTWGYNHMMD